jgi:hypothetical protein
LITEKRLVSEENRGLKIMTNLDWCEAVNGCGHAGARVGLRA